MDGVIQRRKRKRTVLTCSGCRTRKIKCDQQSPCSACVKRRIPPEMCVYEKFPYADVDKGAMEQLRRENDELRRQIQGEPSHAGPPLKFQHKMVLKRDRTLFYGATCWRANTLLRSDVCREIFDDINLFYSNKRREIRLRVHQGTEPFDRFKDMETRSPPELLASLSRYLPDYDTFKSLLGTFGVSFWSRFVPIVDLTLLNADFLKLFSKDPLTGQCSISVLSKYIDYAKVALIIVIFKYTTLTLGMRNTSIKFSDMGQLVQYAKSLLRFSNSDQRTTIPALQTTLLMNSLLSMPLDPGNGDGGDGSNGSLLLRSAVGMAILMGLNKDVDKIFPDKSITFRKLLRRIWLFIYLEDTRGAFNVGLPLCIDDDSVDPVSFGKLAGNDIELLETTRMIRSAVKLAMGAKPVYEEQLADIAKRLEERSYLTNDMGSWDNIEMRLETFTITTHGLFTVYATGTLYGILAQCDVPEYDALEAKYCCLVMSHVLELLSAMAESRAMGDEHVRLLEMALALNGQAKIPVIRAIVSIQTRGVASLEKGGDAAPTSVADVSSRHLARADFSTLQSWSVTSGFLSLWKETMLALRNSAISPVQDLNLSLSGIVALFGHFDGLVRARFPSAAPVGGVETATGASPTAAPAPADWFQSADLMLGAMGPFESWLAADDILELFASPNS